MCHTVRDLKILNLPGGGGVVLLENCVGFWLETFKVPNLNDWLLLNKGAAHESPNVGSQLIPYQAPAK